MQTKYDIGDVVLYPIKITSATILENEKVLYSAEVNTNDEVHIARVQEKMIISKQDVNLYINDFADWCYLKGIDFSHMGKADEEPFVNRVIKQYWEERLNSEADRR